MNRIVVALAVYAVLLMALFLVGTPSVVTDKVLDAFVIAGSVAVVLRMGWLALDSIFALNPTDVDKWIAGGVLVAVSVIVIRVFRPAINDITFVSPFFLDLIYAVASITLSFGLFLMATSAWSRSTGITPLGTASAAIIIGGLTAIILALLHVASWRQLPFF